MRQEVRSKVERARSSVRLQPVVDLTQRLVAVRTDTPGDGIRDACRLIAQELEPDFQSEFFESEPGYTSLVATHIFDAPGPTLALCGHVDVVSANERGRNWLHGPWSGDLDGDRLYGRGSLDMKGPLAALVTAAKSVVQARIALSGTLLVIAVPDEEAGGRLGAGALVESGKVKPDAVVIGEPGDGGVCVAHRGKCIVEIETRGRAAHASMPDRGDNAISRMLDVLVALRTTELRHVPHPHLGGPSIAVATTITGGSGTNVIPDSCRATIDVRKVPLMTDDSVLRDLRTRLLEAGVDCSGISMHVVRTAEPAEVSPASRVVRAAVDAYALEFQRTPQIRGMLAATDGWWFSAEPNCDTVMAFGPGSIEECHVVNESVSITELGAFARIYADLVVRFMSPGATSAPDARRYGRVGLGSV